MSRRPEHVAPPEIVSSKHGFEPPKLTPLFIINLQFYNESEAQKYTNNTRIIDIQVQMCERAIELLAIDPNDDAPQLILDIGCGSGLSGSVLEEQGHVWIGVDISQSMLDVAVEREVEGDLLLGDMGQGMPFKAGTFDGAVSISALQWLCNADKKSHNPPKRLHQFFSTLYSSLVSLFAVPNSTTAYSLPILNVSFCRHAMLGPCFSFIPKRPIKSSW